MKADDYDYDVDLLNSYKAIFTTEFNIALFELAKIKKKDNRRLAKKVVDAINNQYPSDVILILASIIADYTKDTNFLESLNKIQFTMGDQNYIQ